MRHTAIRQASLKFLDNIKADLFDIPLKFPSSLFLQEDETLFIGDIVSCTDSNSARYLSIVCDDYSKTLLFRLEHNRPRLMISAHHAYLFETSFSIKDAHSQGINGIWDIGIKIKSISSVLKLS